MRDVEPVCIAVVCGYELGGLAGLWKPWTVVFRTHPWTFAVFVAWLLWHTWLKPDAPYGFPRGRVLP